ncbi:predicted protein [Plenodomus lingam JN3]|uniref:Predicted protein n=1 Tax=Leptosphaeria maculans (strain JN3 / isolate v23.1.3 / race Av1-4-5-6-7-8) TaxID=985895 RepID=E5AF29_LEPMJ|nr:predicted protein [Plenodomus lingam JN3]CBY01818.1 predicted protein [Plenodomus lingam JN3]
MNAIGHDDFIYCTRTGVLAPCSPMTCAACKEGVVLGQSDKI